jgi:hypothetical protein
MVAPHLPVGSPEREALFARLRKTFCEDWKEAEESLKRERARKGDLYFIRAGSAVKIGRTINVVNRLAKMQADNHEELDCVLVLRGRGHEEPEWHKRFRSAHIRGEWFRWTEPLEGAVMVARELQRQCAQKGQQ